MDALDMHLHGTCPRSLLLRTLEHLRVAMERVRIYEREYSIALGRDTARRTITDILLAAEVAQIVEANTSESCAAASTRHELGAPDEGTQHGGPAHLLSASARHFNGA